MSLFFIQHFAPLNALWSNLKTRPPGLSSSFPTPAIKSHHIPDIRRPAPVMCIAHKQYTFNSAADVFYITFNSESEGFNFPRWDGGGTGTYTKSYFLGPRVPLRLPLISCPSVRNLSSPSISQFSSTCSSSPSLLKTQYSGPL